MRIVVARRQMLAIRRAPVEEIEHDLQVVVLMVKLRGVVGHGVLLG